jgi:hypothetical protein
LPLDDNNPSITIEHVLDPNSRSSTSSRTLSDFLTNFFD